MRNVVKFTLKDFVSFSKAQYGLTDAQASALFNQWAIVMRYVDRYSDKNINVKNAMISHVNTVLHDSTLMRSLKVDGSTSGLSFIQMCSPELYDLLAKKKEVIQPALQEAFDDLKARKVNISYVEIDVTLNDDKYLSERVIDVMDANGQSISRGWTKLTNWSGSIWDRFTGAVADGTDAVLVNTGIKDAPKTVTTGSFGGDDESPAMQESRTIRVDDDAFNSIEVRAGAPPIKKGSNPTFPSEKIGRSDSSESYSSSDPNTSEDPIFTFINS